MSQASGNGEQRQPPDWDAILPRLASELETEPEMLEAIGRLEAGENAFPEDLLARGRQIFETACATTAEHLCDDPRVRGLLDANGPRVSEALTIVPLLFNLLPDQALRDASIALIALLVVRMGIGTFCERYSGPHHDAG